MSLEPGQFCKVSSIIRKSFDGLHLKRAPGWGFRALRATANDELLMRGSIQAVKTSTNRSFYR